MSGEQQSRGNFGHLDLEAAARKATCHVVKARARHYMRRPGALEALYPGLSMAPAATLVAVAEHLVARERESPRRWFGFGGEISLTNATGGSAAGSSPAHSRAAALRETPADGEAP